MTADDLFYLRPNIQVEPLVDQWYAWTHLIPPATTARNISERHVKIMESYINAPMVHANAVKNPKMLGGPFVDYGGKRVDEIKALLQNTKNDRADLLELSKALGDLDTLLKTKAKGFSLQPLYSSVPDTLKGYVELTYDLNNCPSFRLFEPLLYKSRFYNKSAQTLMLSLTTGDDRPFVLSTPRLESDENLHLKIPFDSEVVDLLFRLKYEPKEFGWIKDLLGVPAGSEQLLRSFLTTDPPPLYQPYAGPGIRWRYFGHACVLIETNGVSMLFDPVLSYTYESKISRYTYFDLPESIDYVLITHNHQDHVLYETLLQIRHRVSNVIVPRSNGRALQDPSLKLLLETSGFKSVHELDVLSEIKTENGAIIGLPFLGEHADLDIQCKLAYLIKAGKRKFLYAADSCNIEPMMYQRLHAEIGDVDALFLGMECDGAPLTWLYGPLMTYHIERGMDESRRLAGSDFEQAIKIVDQFRCREVYVYAMGQEPWLSYISSIKYTEQSRPIIESNKLVQACRERGLVAERLFGEKEILLP
jgi:L-ascorbate metabolism protein UlaG (beta-lactamase superfamily)